MLAAPLMQPTAMTPQQDSAAMIPLSFTVRGVPGQVRLRISELSHWEEKCRYKIKSANYVHDISQPGVRLTVMRDAFSSFSWRPDVEYELDCEDIDAGSSSNTTSTPPKRANIVRAPPAPKEKSFWSFFLPGCAAEDQAEGDRPTPLPWSNDKDAAQGSDVSVSEETLRVLQETVSHLQSEIRTMRQDTLPSTAITTATRALRRVEGMEARAADEARRVDAELAAMRSAMEERSSALYERERRLAAVEQTLLELREHLRQRVDSEEAARATAAAQRAAEEAGAARARIEALERAIEVARSEQARASEASAAMAAVHTAALEQAKKQLQKALEEHGSAAAAEIDGVKKHVLELARGAVEAEEASAARVARLEESMQIPAAALDSLEAKLVDLAERQRGMLSGLTELIEQAIQARAHEVGAAAGRSVEEALAGIQQRVAALEENARAQRALVDEAPSRLRAVASRLEGGDAVMALSGPGSPLDLAQLRARIDALASQQEKLRKDLSREEETSDRRIAGVIDELSRAALSIKRLERLIAAQETDKLRVDELNRKILAELEDALWRIDELEERSGAAADADAEEDAQGDARSAAGAAGRAGSGGPAAVSPPSSLASMRSTPSRGGEGPMALQRAVASLASRNVHVREVADAVAAFASAAAQRAGPEEDATRADLRALANALVDLFAKGAKKQKTGFFSFGSSSEGYHLWDAFEAFAAANPLQDPEDSRPLPTFLYTAVEANARINPGSYAVARAASAWGLKDAKFHSFLRAALNCRGLHASFRDLFGAAQPVLACLYDEWAPAMHAQTQKDLVIALEPLAALPCEYAIDLLMLKPAAAGDASSSSHGHSPAGSVRGSSQSSPRGQPLSSLRK
eukprot:tig00000093_g3573.t1